MKIEAGNSRSVVKNNGFAILFHEECPFLQEIIVLKFYALSLDFIAENFLFLSVAQGAIILNQSLWWVFGLNEKR